MFKTLIHKMILAGILLSGLVSCVKSEVFDRGMSDTPMLFSTYSPRNVDGTKADGSYIAPGNTVLPANSDFGVFAFLQEGDVAAGTVAHWNTSREPNFMFNEQVHYSLSGYSYSPLRYWPANDENTISFWAYYPYSVYATDNTGALKLYSNDACTIDYESSSTGLPRVKYTVPTDAHNQSDLLFDSFEKQDMTYSSCSPTPGTVDLNFRHALCAVQFTIEMPDGAGTLGTDYYFEFNELAIRNIKLTGICLNPGAATISWSSLADADDISTTEYNVTEGRSDIFLLIPQTLGNEITLDMDVLMKFHSSDDPTNPAADLAYPFQISGLKLNSATGGPDHWEANKRYTYNLKLSLERIEFSATVSDWIDAGTIDISEE